MQFKVVSSLAFATLVASIGDPSGPTIVPPFPGNPLPTVRGSQCWTGKLQCCKSGQAPTSSIASSALGHFGISTGSVGGLVGINCDTMTTGSRSCNDTPLCCTQPGSVSVACNPVDLSV